MFAIETTNLTKKYQDFQALDQINLTIKPGEIYGFIGLNGAGKTTTMRTLLNMVKPTSGHVDILGQDVSKVPSEFWNQVGYLIETPHAYGNLTVSQNLDLYGKMRLIPKKERQQTINKLMNDLRLTPYKDKLVRDLSLGNNQKIGLIKALMHHPKILLLDEPTNGLDPVGLTAVRQLLLKESQQNGTTILISSHILDEMEKLITSMGIISHGKLLEQLKMTEFNATASKYLQLQFQSSNQLQQAQLLLSKSDYLIESTTNSLKVLLEKASDVDEIKYLLQANQLLVDSSLVIQESLEHYFLKKIGETK